MLMLTLQFIRPLQRERLMQDVYRGMNENGALILVEKVIGEDSLFNRLFIKYYYDFKRRSGYSDLEIAQKREALENVLVPYKLLENRETAAAHRLPLRGRVLQVVQLLRHHRGQVMVALGNFLYRTRLYVFPAGAACSSSSRPADPRERSRRGADRASWSR